MLRLLLRRRKPPGHTYFGSALPGAVILSLLLILLAACQAEPNDPLPPAASSTVLLPSATAPPPVLDAELRIRASPFLHPTACPEQLVWVSANGKLLGSWRITDPKERVYSIRIPKDALRFGFLIVGPFGPGYLWHHMNCAARRHLGRLEEAVGRR